MQIITSSKKWWIDSRVFWVLDDFCKDFSVIVSFWELKKCINDIVLWRDYLQCRVFEFYSGEDVTVRKSYGYVRATFVRTNLESDRGDNTLVNDEDCSCNLDSTLHFSIIINYTITFGYFFHQYLIFFDFLRSLRLLWDQLFVIS